MIIEISIASRLQIIFYFVKIYCISMQSIGELTFTGKKEECLRISCRKQDFLLCELISLTQRSSICYYEYGMGGESGEVLCNDRSILREYPGSLGQISGKRCISSRQIYRCPVVSIEHFMAFTFVGVVICIYLYICSAELVDR